MRPVVSIAEMRAADARALEEVTEATLVERAGTAVATAAIDMMGGAYGRRVTVLAGKGNNGADGRVAARYLAARGARVSVIAADGCPAAIDSCDLFIDAAYGTGFRGTYEPPKLAPGTPVLAVDIPSGVDGDTGVALGRPLAATRTVTFAALKAGLLQGDGARLAGSIEIADIRIPVDSSAVGVVEDADVARLPARRRQTHKWASALCVVAGSPGMEGAAILSARGAARSGAGMVRLAVPGEESVGPGGWPPEVVRVRVHATTFAEELVTVLGRCRALVVGPGLGPEPAVHAQVRDLVAHSPVPVVADADALVALGPADAIGAMTPTMRAPLVLTPHDGEFRTLTGVAPGEDRIDAARGLCEETGAVVLLKGPTTVIAAPSGTAARPDPDTLLVTSGTPRLATAGTGDVLSGVIGAFLAAGLSPQWAAGLGAHVHGRAARSGPRWGLVADDLPELVGRWLSEAAIGDGDG